MFDRIAGRYDFLNHFLSLNRDRIWRKKLAGQLPNGDNLSALDLATGTADQLLALQSGGQVSSGAGLDMALEMLKIGQLKLVQQGLENRFALVRADACCLPFAAESFEVVSISFGIRNVLDVDLALREMARVLRPGGRALILEFSLPSSVILRKLYLFYFRRILPRLGGMISGDRHAYRYLNETVESFPYGDSFCALMSKAGFVDVQGTPLTFGIATLYQGDKT